MTNSSRISFCSTLTPPRDWRVHSMLLIAGLFTVAGCAGGEGEAMTAEPDADALSQGGAPSGVDGVEETGTETETASLVPDFPRAEGCSVFSSASTGSWTIPGGVFCFGLVGTAAPKGHGATYMYGKWTAPNASNWRIDFVGYDRNHKVWWKETGPSHFTTNYGTGKRVRKDPKGWLEYGEACAEFYQNGRHIDSACLSITP